MALTSRQALNRALKETATATYFVVKFTEDEEVSVVPAKCIVDPSPSSLKVSSLCSVRWSDKRTYNATVLAIGESKVHTDINLCVGTFKFLLFL